MLKNYNLENFRNGVYKYPEKSCVNKTTIVEYKFLVQQDQMISSWIVGYMTREFVKKVQDCDTSCDT